MHQRSKWVTLTLFKKGENYFLSQIPPINALAFTEFKSARVQGKGNVEGESRRRHQRRSPGWQQTSLFFYVLSIPLLHGSPITLEGCAALRGSQCISSPSSACRFVLLPCQCVPLLPWNSRLANKMHFHSLWKLFDLVGVYVALQDECMLCPL